MAFALEQTEKVEERLLANAESLTQLGGRHRCLATGEQGDGAFGNRVDGGR